MANSKNGLLRLWCGSALLVMAAGLPSIASAQEQTPPEDDEIVVTGSKREETTLETPVTVSVLNAQMLEQNNVYDLQSLATIAVGFNYERAPGNNLTASIRGIGTAPGATSLEQSIAPYIDGVYQAGTQRGFAWPVFDLERVEVFRGTQSGIVGQNTSVGVINMVTRAPGQEFGGFLDGSYEFENEGYGLQGAIDLPLSDTFRVRLSGLHQEIGGWARNFATGHDISNTTLDAARVRAVWEPSPTFAMDFYLEYDELLSDGPIVAHVFDDPTGGYATAIAPWFTYNPSQPNVAYSDPRGRAGGDDQTESDNLRGSVTLNWDLGGGFNLTSITAASRENDFLQVDQDFTPAPCPPPNAAAQVCQALSQESTYNQVTQEVRFASPSEDRFNYILGGWYRHAETDRVFRFYRDRFVQNDLAVLPYDQTIDNAAIFADLQYQLTDQWTIGGSLRYTNETKTSISSGTSNWPVVFLGFPQTRIELEESFLDGSLRLEYEPTDTLNIYAAYAHGTKTGAVPDIVGSGILQILQPEVAETFEIGVKGTLFNNVLTYELAVFQSNITDFQDVSSQIVGGLSVFFASNSDVETTGADINLRLRPVEGLELGLTAEYLDAFNESFNGPHVRSPEWAWILDGRLTFPVQIAGGDVSIFGSVQHKDTYRTQPAYVATTFGPSAIPTVIATQSPEFTRWNVGIEYSLNDQLDLTLTCRNCGDEIEYTRVITAAMFGAPVRYGYLNELRTITLGLRHSF